MNEGGGQGPEAQAPAAETVIQPPVREATPDLGDRVPADKLLEKAQANEAAAKAQITATEDQINKMAAATPKDSPTSEWLDKSAGNSAPADTTPASPPSAEASKANPFRSLLKKLGL